MTSEPVHTALLSYGMSGAVFHAPLLDAHHGFTLAAVLRRSTEEAIQRYPQARVVTDINAIAGDARIELVVVNTPNESHYTFAAQMLEAGKHVIVEKPFAVTVQEADKLIALSKEKKKMLAVFQNRRWDGDFLTLRRVVEQRLVGPIVEFEAHYDRFRNYIESNTWKEESGPGSGIAYNLGSHMLDQVIVLFGMPRRVDARIGVQRPGGKVDDYYDIRLHYDDVNVIVKSSYLVREPGPRYTLHGTQGSFVKYGIDPQEQALKDGLIPGTAGWGVEDRRYWGKLNTAIGDLHVEGTIETLPGNYLAFYDEVHRAIRHDVPLTVKPEQSRDGLRLIEACYESNRLQRAVNIDQGHAR